MNNFFDKMLLDLRGMIELSNDKIVVIGGVAVFLWTKFSLDEDP